MVSVHGTFLVVGAGVRDVLGWGVGEVIGKGLLSFVVGDGNGRRLLEEQLVRMRKGNEPVRVVCEMGDKEGGRVPVQIVLCGGREQGSTTSPSPVICQIRALDSPPLPASHSFAHLHHTNVFEELETNRGSNWQYELQQLKFANQRLMEEIEALESPMVLHDHQHAAPPQFTTVSFPDQNPHSSQHISHKWTSTHMREHEPLRPMKRTWDLDAVPSS
jgi:hypothetical protein